MGSSIGFPQKAKVGLNTVVAAFPSMTSSKRSWVTVSSPFPWRRGLPCHCVGSSRPWLPMPFTVMIPCGDNGSKKAVTRTGITFGGPSTRTATLSNEGALIPCCQSHREFTLTLTGIISVKTVSTWCPMREHRVRCLVRGFHLQQQRPGSDEISA